jgi:hypothetical protein
VPVWQGATKFQQRRSFHHLLSIDIQPRIELAKTAFYEAEIDAVKKSFNFGNFDPNLIKKYENTPAFVMNLNRNRQKWMKVTKIRNTT